MRQETNNYIIFLMSAQVLNRLTRFHRVLYSTDLRIDVNNRDCGSRELTVIISGFYCVQTIWQAEAPGELQILLKRLNQMCESWKIHINPLKCEILHFSSTKTKQIDSQSMIKYIWFSPLIWIFQNTIGRTVEMWLILLC